MTKNIEEISHIKRHYTVPNLELKARDCARIAIFSKVEVYEKNTAGATK
jgi:hypothetical protein